MSDLISRSALEKYLRDYKWEFALGSDFSKVMEMVDAQPTAYNVDKVIEQLGRESYQEFCDSPQIVDLNDAVYLVRKGGV